MQVFGGEGGGDRSTDLRREANRLERTSCPKQNRANPSWRRPRKALAESLRHAMWKPSKRRTLLKRAKRAPSPSVFAAPAQAMMTSSKSGAIFTPQAPLVSKPAIVNSSFRGTWKSGESQHHDVAPYARLIRLRTPLVLSDGTVIQLSGEIALPSPSPGTSRAMMPRPTIIDASPKVSDRQSPRRRLTSNNSAFHRGISRSLNIIRFLKALIVRLRLSPMRHPLADRKSCRDRSLRRFFDPGGGQACGPCRNHLAGEPCTFRISLSPVD